MNINGRTLVFGILGDPVAHSLSPLMHNAAFEALEIEAVYVPLHVRPSDLSRAAAGIRALNIRGVNVTVPHKEEILPHLDEIDPLAARIGAVNTVVNRDGRLIGFNTDGIGFLRSLSEDLSFEPAGKRILLLGAGGACRAALVILAESGAHSIGIANRTPPRAQGLVAQFAPQFPGTRFAPFGLDEEELARALEGADLIVNTSSIGLKGESFAKFPWDLASPPLLFYDMVYGGRGTPLLRSALDRGHEGADGIGMLAGQGEEAFFLWTGRRPPAGLMRSILKKNAAQ